MRRLGTFLVIVFSTLVIVSSLSERASAAEPDSSRTAPKAAHGLPLSGMTVSITSCGHTATFRLYDTDAAREFYGQLPLTLQLSNFRDAQWMFYPPRKLNVTDRTSYHDGKKGELSYYAPWGDVFMLYRDFQAGDEMHRLGIGLSGIDQIQAMSGDALIRKTTAQMQGTGRPMRIAVKTEKHTLVYELNNSPAAKALYAQLPIRIAVENYGGIEKIFYPPEKLDTADTPLAKDVKAGTLAYYGPWGDVVMFHDRFHAAPGLYELGRILSGVGEIQGLSGTVRIEKVDAASD